MFFKIGIFKKFAIFTGKTPVLQSLFNKVAGLQTCTWRPATLLKKTNCRVSFPVYQDENLCCFYFCIIGARKKPFFLKLILTKSSQNNPMVTLGELF